MGNPYSPPGSDISRKENSFLKPTEMPISVRILKGVLVFIIVVLVIRILPALVGLPKTLGSSILSSMLAVLLVGMVLDIAVLALAISTLKWVRQRSPRGRLGSLFIVFICMGSLGLSLPKMDAGMSQEQVEFQLGAAIAIVLPWLGFLALGLRLVFSKSVKAYFSATR